MRRVGGWRGVAVAALGLVASAARASAQVEPAAPGVAVSGLSAGAGRAVVIEVVRRGSSTVETEPGALITIPFLLRNRTSGAVQVQTEADVPAGWRRVVARNRESLAGRDSVVHLLSVHVPGGAVPGRYVIVYRAQVEGLAESVAADTVAVVVRAIRELRLSVAEAPRLVEAGASYEVVYLVRNVGNVRTRVELEVVAGSGFSTKLDSTGVTLDPAEGRAIRVTVGTDPRLRATVRSPVTLRARAADDGGEPGVPQRERVGPATATSVVEVVARGTDAGGPSNTLPLRLALRSGWPWGGVPPLELSGGGWLSASRGVRLDVLLRGPGTGGTALFADREEYRLELRGRDFELAVGDRVYDRGRLLQMPWYAFGAAGTVARGGLELGGFAAGDRLMRGGSSRRAGFVGYRFGGSYLRLQYDEQTGLNGGRAWGGQGSLAVIPGVSVTGEYGIGERDSGGDRSEAAHAIELRAGRSAARFEARRLRVDPGYPSDYRGMSQDYVGLSLKPWGKFRVGAWLDRTDRDPGDGSRLSGRTQAVDLAYGGLATLALRAERRTGAYPGLSYDRWARSARLNLRVDAGSVRVGPDIELGSTRDLLEGTESPFRHYSVNVSAGGPAAAFSAWVDRFSGQSVYLAAPQAWLAAGVQTSLRLGRDTRLRLSLSTRRYEATGAWGATIVDFGFERRLSFGHSIASHVRGVVPGSPGSKGRTDAFLEYAIPFQVALPNTGGGRVIGRIYDAETGSALAGVPVRLGTRTALSDAQGRVQFDRVAPGTHYVTLDHLATGNDRVPLVELPLRVDVQDGEAARFEVGLVRGGRLSGVVRRYVHEEVTHLGQVPELRDAGGAANVLVEASNGTEVHRRLTDPHGRFDFGLLRPGRWTLEVRAGDLPRSREVEDSPRVIDLAAGDAQSVTLRIVPVRREVQIVRRAEITVQPEPAAPPAGGRGQGVRYHLVQPGERRLVDVAQKLYGDASLWPKIWVANRREVTDPDVIRVGQRLVIPPPGPLTAEEREALQRYRERGGRPLSTPPTP